MDLRGGDPLKTQLDYVAEHARQRPQDVWLTQPLANGAVRDFTFAEAHEEARRMAAHLAALAMPARSHIAILSKNTAWWVIADLAIWMAGHVSVPIYPNLTAANVRAILEHSGARLVFLGKLDASAEMEKGIPDGVPRILMPLATASSGTAWEHVLATTEPLSAVVAPDPDALATIMYTSGSTGEPKGVMHSFRTMGAVHALIASNRMTVEDRLLSYLPLAHVAERSLMETTACIVGYRVYFAEGLATFVADLRRARPTIFGSVPRLWQKFQGGVLESLSQRTLSLLLAIPIVARVVRRRILAGLGLDAARLTVTGSAPTPPELTRWYAALGVELLDVYGMTENFAVSHAAEPGRARIGYVGRPVPGVEHKLSRTGEILIRSPGNMLGYYHAPDLTAQMIDAEGYLHTGDCGEIDELGRLRITGRVKEIFKTSKGKYVAPGPIEQALLAHPHIDQACVFGEQLAQPVAMVVLVPHLRAASATSRAALAAALEGHLLQLNTTLDQHARLDTVVVVGEEWTVENGLLTPTLKLKRSAVEGRYASQAPVWVARGERVVWA